VTNREKFLKWVRDGVDAGFLSPAAEAQLFDYTAIERIERQSARLRANQPDITDGALRRKLAGRDRRVFDMLRSS
jgi:hypothetical protein